MKLIKIFSFIAFAVLFSTIFSAMASANNSTENNYNETSAEITADDYLGTWGAGRFNLYIAKADDGDEYNAYVKWAISPARSINWTYRCTYDSDSKILICNGGGTCVDCVFEKGSGLKFDEKYNDGSCKFILREGRLTWQDDKENMGDSISFFHVKVNQ